jgi:hypothetical protein
MGQVGSCRVAGSKFLARARPVILSGRVRIFNCNFRVRLVLGNWVTTFDPQNFGNDKTLRSS